MATAALPSQSLHTKLTGAWGRNVVIAIPMVFLLLVFMLPFLVVFKISLSEMDTVFFKDVFALRDDVIVMTLKFGNYISLTQDSLYINAYLSPSRLPPSPRSFVLPSPTRLRISWRVVRRTGVPLC